MLVPTPRRAEIHECLCIGCTQLHDGLTTTPDQLPVHHVAEAGQRGLHMQGGSGHVSLGRGHD